MAFYINDSFPSKKYFVGMDAGLGSPRHGPNMMGAPVITEYENGAYKTKLHSTQQGCEDFINKLLAKGWRRKPL